MSRATAGATRTLLRLSCSERAEDREFARLVAEDMPFWSQQPPTRYRRFRCWLADERGSIVLWAIVILMSMLMTFGLIIVYATTPGALATVR